MARLVTLSASAARGGALARSVFARPGPGSLAARARGIDRWLGWLLGFSAILLGTGWFAPVMTVRELFFVDRSLSLFEAIGTLWNHGEYVLMAMVVIFSFLFPGAKLIMTLALWRRPNIGGPGLERRVRRLETLGKWSMLDVFLIALGVAALNISLITDVHLHWGIYLLAAGVLLSMVVFTRLTTLVSRILREEQNPTDQNPSPS